MIKDSRSYEVQIIDAVRSVNRALGGTYGTSSAINKTEFNQYEVQLIDAIKGIGRTLSGKGLSLAGGGAADLSGYATVAQFQDLSRRVTILENESFFRLVDGNVTLKEQYQNLWVPGWLAAGGIGSDGGGGVSYLCELEDVYHTSGSGVLRADGTDVVPGDSLVYNSTLGWVAAPVSGGGGSGTVTGIKMNGNTLSPSTTGIVDLGTVITSLSGYATQQWVQQQGYLTSYTETDPTVPAWAKAANPLLYVGYSQVQTTAQAQYLFGIPYINATNSASSKSRMVWDSTNDAWHFYGNIYADGWVSAGGIGSSGGGGGGSTVEISNLLSSGTRIATITVDGDDYDILAPAGTVTSIKLGATTYSPVSGVVSLPAYPSTLSDLSGTSDLQAIEALSGTSGLLRKTGSNTWSLDTTSYLSSHQTIYKLTLNAGTFTAGEYMPNSASKTFNIPTTLDHVSDGTNRKLSDYVTLHTTQTIDGAKTFADNPVTIASTSGLSVHASSYIDIGDARLVYDSGSKALHVTMKSGSSNTIGFFADGFVSAGGVAATTNIQFVTLSSSQTITGDKEFDGTVTLYGMFNVDCPTIFSEDISLSGNLNGLSITKDNSNYVTLRAPRIDIQDNGNNLFLCRGSGKVFLCGHPGGTVSQKLYLDSSSTAIAQSWNTHSDIRLKDDITPVSGDEAVRTIMALNPVTWRWKEGGAQASGLIAQEVEKVIPFMVTDGEYKGLAYQMLHAYELSAIRSHEARIKFLERENDALRKEIERLKS